MAEKQYRLKRRITCPVGEYAAGTVRSQGYWEQQFLIPKGEIDYSSWFEPVEEKDWEIVAFRFLNGMVEKDKAGNFRHAAFGQMTEEQALERQYPIHSVKRLSDGVVFTVGDKIKIGSAAKAETIASIEIDQSWDGGIKLNHSNGVVAISFAQPAPERQFLFTTEDGVDMYEGDRAYYVVPKLNYFVGYWDIEVGNKLPLPEGWIYFSTEQAAEAYIAENKPQYSLKQMREAREESRLMGPWLSFKHNAFEDCLKTMAK